MMTVRMTEENDNKDDSKNNREKQADDRLRRHQQTTYTFTFTFMHLADAFIQSDLQLHSGYTFSLVHVFPGKRTHNLLRC